MRLRDLPTIAGLALAVMFLNVLVSFVVVWVYSLFEPGHPEAFYYAFAEKAAPVSSVVAGIPLMFAAGMLVARRRPPRQALMAAAAVALFYILIDSIIIFAAAAGAGVWGWELLSYSTKLLAAVAGAALSPSSRAARAAIER